MEPVYYVIAILGCADGSTQCTPVATVPTHYASQEACTAGTQQALAANSDFDFPTLMAQCRNAAGRYRFAGSAGKAAGVCASGLTDVRRRGTHDP